MTAKWRRFVHNGVYFPPEYQPRGLSIKIHDKKLQLTPQQEEMAYAWAKKTGTPYAADKVFAENFLTDFKKLLPADMADVMMKDIDFSDIVKVQQEEKELTKDRKKDLAAERKKLRERLKGKYGYVEIDGIKTDVANWMVEPPGIFIGRGNHPMRGKWKPRVYAEDVVLNLSSDAPLPQGKWKKIINGTDFMWVASWEDKLVHKMKYVWPSEGSLLRQEKEKQKYDKAMIIDRNMPAIRKQILSGMQSQDERVRKVATVCYLIDRLVMRVGDEKDEDEADTVGASTLRVEHVKFAPSGVDFDFLGKDSVRWQKSLPMSEADPTFVKCMKEFAQGKKPSDLVFDGINSRAVNDFFRTCMKGLTAKVFRTYHATKTLASYLKDVKVKPTDSDWKKLYYAKLANLQVAVVCNHKKTPSKTWEDAFARKEEKLEKLMKAKPKTEKQAEKLKERIEKLRLDIEMVQKTKELNLNTSLKNYIDPRVYRAWMDKIGMDWSRLYTATLQKKFSWTEKK